MNDWHTLDELRVVPGGCPCGGDCSTITTAPQDDADAPDAPFVLEDDD